MNVLQKEIALEIVGDIEEITGWNRLFDFSSPDDTQHLINSEVHYNVLGEKTRYWLIRAIPSDTADLLKKTETGKLLPTLYDLVFTDKQDSKKINYHAVQFVETFNNGLNFMHLTDLHVAQRNDEILDEVLKKEKNEDKSGKSKKKKEYLFSWEEVPGNDSGRLIKFLKQEFGISWVETAKIEKIDNDRNIRVTTEKNYLSLGLNNEKTKVNLKIDDGRSAEFIVKNESGKLNIYKKEEIRSREDIKKAYINFNDNFRMVVHKANEMAKRGELDFIVLTGDIVDFAGLGWDEEICLAENNWKIFMDIATGQGNEKNKSFRLKGTDNEIFNQGLKIAIFTSTGNHDWRLHPGALLPYVGEGEYKKFGLNEEEAKNYNYKSFDSSEYPSDKKQPSDGHDSRALRRLKLDAIEDKISIEVLDKLNKWVFVVLMGLAGGGLVWSAGGISIPDEIPVHPTDIIVIILTLLAVLLIYTNKWILGKLGVLIDLVGVCLTWLLKELHAVFIRLNYLIKRILRVGLARLILLGLILLGLILLLKQLGLLNLPVPQELYYLNLKKIIVIVSTLLAVGFIILKYHLRKYTDFLVDNPSHAEVKALHYYFKHINPYFDYAFSFGNKHFILMDTGADVAAIGAQKLLDGRKAEELKKVSLGDTLGMSPDSMAFDDRQAFCNWSQIVWLDKVLSCVSTKGEMDKIFICVHAPPLNYDTNYKNKLNSLRESETKTFIEEENEPNIDLKGFIDYYITQKLGSKRENDKSLNLTYGTINHYLSQFFFLCRGLRENPHRRIDPSLGSNLKIVDMVLSGHAHIDVEFRIDIDKKDPHESKVRIYHDKYSVYTKDFYDSKTFIVQTAACGPPGDDAESPPYWRMIKVDKQNSITSFKQENFG